MVQKKRTETHAANITNWTAIVFFLPNLSITNIVANIPDTHRTNFSKNKFVIHFTVQ